MGCSAVESPPPHTGDAGTRAHGCSPAAELAALAHERVPGAWQQLCSFTGILSVNKYLNLGPASAVHCLLAYPGWHMLRAELVRRSRCC
jgi:hypothetical protein